MITRASALAIVIVGVLAASLPAQILVPRQMIRVIHPPGPPIRPIPSPIVSSYKIRSVDVRADIHDQFARVRMSQVFQNTGSTALETQFLFPIPADAAVSELTLLYDGKELPGRLLNKEDARRIYEEIVRRQRDPALLEYLGQGLFQTSVFPIPPHAERTVEIRYSQLLKKDGDLVDFLLPLGTFRHANQEIEAFSINLRMETSEAIKTVYSPTHSINIERPDDHHAMVKLSLKNVSAPDDLRILCGTHAGPLGMSLVSYRPTEKEDGYFMLLASPELKTAPGAAAPKTEILVIDRSGSMSGPKIEQARQAAKFFLHQLKASDTFNIIAYDSEVQAFRPELQRVSPETINAALSFADGLNAGGGTNIDAALKTALGMLNDNKRPSYVLFCTDGMPTVGEQNEVKIVEHAQQADRVNARIFNLGIGYDVNSRLLDRLSRDLVGQSVYVRPNENVETYVSALASKIGSPLLTNVSVHFEFDLPTAAGSAEPISRTYPRKLTDLFAGEQLVWVGRYRNTGAVKVTLVGDFGGKQQQFTLTANLAKLSVGDLDRFVERVWAIRRIGELIDQIDLNGQNPELVKELVELSKQHGILTPYTSFLAEEGVSLTETTVQSRRAGESLEQLNVREGKAAFGQRMMKSQLKLAGSAPMQGGMGGYFSAPSGGRPLTPALGIPAEKLAEGEARPSIRTIGQKTFYWKNDTWRDSELTANNEKNPVRIKPFSEAYFTLAARNNGKFAKYLALEGPILIAVEGQSYFIESNGNE